MQALAGAVSEVGNVVSEYVAPLAEDAGRETDDGWGADTILPEDDDEPKEVPRERAQVRSRTEAREFGAFLRIAVKARIGMLCMLGWWQLSTFTHHVSGAQSTLSSCLITVATGCSSPSS